ncbi:MAG: response regulator [Thermoanaerobaculia bacterium]
MVKKILLADDSLTIQKVVELTFSDGEFELVCVSNGQKALERVREERPDLILADVVMPEKNGYEVCEAIKSNPATARIPVVLLSGTFEPFDRERAERIGSDAVVSKPFDSQQLLVQVEDLLGRARTQGAAAGQPMPAAAASMPASAAAQQSEPFDAGFASEDFTGSIRRPPRREAGDPFEEEYGRGDVDSAVAAFEREHPDFVPGSGQDTAQPDVAEKPLSRADPSRGPLGQWLRDEPEKAAPPLIGAPGSGAGTGVWQVSEPTGPIAHAFDKAVQVSEQPAAVPADQAPTQEIPQPSAGSRHSESERTLPAREISATEAQTLFEREKRAAQEPPEAGRAAQTAEVPREIEIMAQFASIPELKQMLSSVVKPGEELSEDQMEKLAIRVVEKLSERIVREIAWEIIPDMAEIVIKRRIKELETGIE